MSFVLKRKSDVAPHRCNVPPQTQNKPLVPGDIWQCDDCGRYAIWCPSFSSEGWSGISERAARKELKRFAKGKPFKRTLDRGPGPG